MANLLTALLSKPKFVIVNESDDGRIVARSLKIVSVRFRLDSIMPKHKLENGTTFSDTRIMLPHQIELDVISPNIDTSKTVMQMNHDLESLYSIVARGYTYKSLVCKGVTVTNAPEMLTSTPLTLKFTRLMFPGTKTGIYEQGADSSLIDRGISALNSVKSTVGNATAFAGGIKSKIGGLF